MLRDVSLEDRYDLGASPVLLNGTQALVRLMLMQKSRDRAAGLDTAGYVTGYRGSPLGAVDFQMRAAEKHLKESDILFREGLNEDLAATALWGAQQAELRGEGRFDGVFGLWYGKGPGVDRSGDVMRHANMAGTSRNGGVLMAMGDDHTGESSTTLHQSEMALMDACMPIVSPAGVQEILDYGIYGWALSRFAGVWVGLKTMKDTVETTAVVDGRPDRMRLETPEFAMPEGGLNIRLVDTPTEQEARLVDHKLDAAEAFSRRNRMDGRAWGRPGAGVGFVAAGKNWLDLVHAMSLLNISEADAERLGITLYKVGQTFPLDAEGFREWAEGLDRIVIVEEKRKLIEARVKEALFDDRRGLRVDGRHKGGAGREGREELFPARGALDPLLIAEKIGGILIEEGRGTEAVRAGLDVVLQARRADNAPEIAARLPYFCSGCPHNTSTRIPEGSRAYAGIGCHYMAQWMDRGTLGFTHMGGEGGNWIGEEPFSTRGHVFQNIGDGTYNHSGFQSIRAALAQGTNITFKILYNDAVAMTGGQGNDGGLDAARIVNEIRGMGVRTIHVVHDEKEGFDPKTLPEGVEASGREDLMKVQEKLAETKGVSALVYVQTCAAEKRRRRKRGLFPDPDRRVFINTDVCEGCGDCGVQSNCVSIVPVETEFGRKRAVDQSSCNKDFSCVDGFCPAFVTLGGTGRKKAAGEVPRIGDTAEPELPSIAGTHNIVIAGVGGTGVVTIGAVLAMAAHLDGKGVGMMEMAGLAQKGGAVHIHARIAERPEDISAIRVAAGEADAVIGGDLVVSAGSKTIGLMSAGRTGAVVNGHEIVTGEFTRNADFSLPGDQLRLSLEARLRDRLELFDASELARRTLGDSIFSNMLVFGAAWQKGLVPISRGAVRRAIELNGAAVEKNLEAFELGRWAMADPDAARAAEPSGTARPPKTLGGIIDVRAAHLTNYQSPKLAGKYRRMLEGIVDDRLREAAAKGYHKLLAYKDEYEVARLHLDTAAKARAAFGGEPVPTFHLAPPFLPGTDARGRPRKRAFGPWVTVVFRLLARMKVLRGTPFDPFGRASERVTERGLIVQYEADMAEIARGVSPSALDAAVELAELPLSIKGFGPVKEANRRVAAARREELLAVLRGEGEVAGE